VFLDIAPIRKGADFITAIDEAIRASFVVLVVIGKHWATTTDPDTGQRRITATDDPVRYEVQSALQSGIAVIPVFVDGATMPQVNDLPPSLIGLTRLNALTLSDTEWAAGTELLLDHIRELQRRTAGEVASMTLMRERERLRQEIENEIDVTKCFVRQPELQSLAPGVLHGNTAAIYGDHGSGKTRLLRELQPLCAGEKIRAVYLDLASERLATETQFFRRIVSDFTSTDPGPVNGWEATIALRSLCERERYAVLMLDNIDIHAEAYPEVFQQEMVFVHGLMFSISADRKLAKDI